MIAVDDLQPCVATRQMIGQAVGIVMCRYAVDQRAAFAYLGRVSQHRNVMLHQVATRMS